MGKSRKLVQVVAQARQITEDGVVFLKDILHDLGIDGSFSDIFGQCTESCHPRPVTDDVILQGTVSYGHGPVLLLHPARSRTTAFVLLFHCSRINVYVCICVNVSMCQCINVYLCKCTYQRFLDSLRSLGLTLSLEQKRKNDRWRCPIVSGMTALHLCHRQSEATSGRFSASENTTSLTSLPFGMGPSVLPVPVSMSSSFRPSNRTRLTLSFP